MSLKLSSEQWISKSAYSDGSRIIHFLWCEPEKFLVPSLPSPSSILPQLHGSIAACGGKETSIGRPRHGIHTSGMTTIDQSQFSSTRLPHPHGFIAVCGSEETPIGRPRHSLHNGTHIKNRGMTTIGQPQFTSA